MPYASRVTLFAKDHPSASIIGCVSCTVTDSRRRPLMSLFIYALVASMTAVAPVDDPDEPAGLVVEQVLPGADVVRGGIEPGDVLLSWSRDAAGPHRPAARGDLRTPLDLMDVEVEQLP